VAEFEDFPHRTRRDPAVTHRDPHVPQARSDPSATRRDAPQPAADPLIRLPGPLAGRFTVVGELPVQGAESDLLLVRDAAGRRYVVKVFRRGYSADREVWAKLPELTSPHVVQILETGHADGRDYELSEYAPGGNLRTMLDARPGEALPPQTVAAIVAQLAAGLQALHRAGIVHRDLKPENVLVTASDPLQVAIADFGLSKVLDQSVVFASSSRTLAYAAPESLSGQVSPARDWWSLGMIVRELATGRPPFAGLSETVVVDHLATRPIDNSDVADPRLRLLCQGLLTRDPRHRWGAEQVTAWLAGQSPPVAAEPRSFAQPDGSGLPFAGRRFTDRAELARALVERWEDAARYFFARGEHGEAWRALREWLGRFPDDSRIELIDAYLATGLPPDVKVLHLVRWLDPTLPPHYLGRRVSAADLPRLAALAGDARHPDHRAACLIGRALWEHRLLPELAKFQGAAELRAIDDRWRAHVAEWNRLVRPQRHGQVPAQPRPPIAQVRLPQAGLAGPEADAPADDPPVVLLTLLALAAAPEQTTASLADAAARARAAAGGAVPWFERLAEWAGAADPRGGDPLRLLAVVRAAPEAAMAAQAADQERRLAERRLAERTRHWEELERRRLAGRGPAVARAVGWTLPILAVWLFGSWLVNALTGSEEVHGPQNPGVQQGIAGVPFGLLVAVSIVAWAVQCGAEVLLARAQGRDYLPYGPWSWLSKVLGASGRGLSRASQVMSASARRTGRRGCGLLLLAGTIPLLIILLLLSMVTAMAGLLWLLVPVAAAATHLVAAGLRLHRWKAEHERARQASLGAPAGSPGGTV